MPIALEINQRLVAMVRKMRLPAMVFWSAFVMMGSIARSVERATDDAGVDLIAALTASGRLDDAERMCRYELDRVPEGQLLAAKWTAQLAKVIAERTGRSIFDGPASGILDRIDPAIAAACQPIDDLITRYPDSEASEFLAAAKLSVRQRFVAASIIAASVSPPNPALVDSLLARIARLQSDAEELRGLASRKWSLRKSQSATAASKNLSLAADQYERLVQELALQRISLASLQCELFAKNSDDQRAAAANVVVIAEQAMLELPESSEARKVAEVLLVEALIGSADLNTAGQWIERRKQGHLIETDPRWIALRVRYELSRQHLAAASQLCEAFYSAAWGNSNDANSIAMDFAMLDVLLADPKAESKVPQWIDGIERRGGLFARRRAESIAIAVLRGTSVASSDPESMPVPRRLSPALIAAQGEDWLRRDDPNQAALLLREASMAEPKPAIALSYATKSAAASMAAKDALAAIDVLRQVAVRFPEESDSAAIAMQAALLAGKPFGTLENAKQRLELLEELLKEISQTWPASDEAMQANQWLCRILVSSQRRDEAARTALELLSLGRRIDQLQPTIANWFAYLIELDVGQVGEQLESLTPAIMELASEDDSLSETLGQMAVLLLDRQSLHTTMRDRMGEIGSTVFLKQLFDFRLHAHTAPHRSPQQQMANDGVAIDITGVDPETLRRARWRLERDAMIDAKSQPAIGALLTHWPHPDDWQSASAAFWRSQDQESIGEIMRLARLGTAGTGAIQRGMDLLASGEAVESKRAAVELADQAAAQMQQGSESWYAAKLQGIHWLNQIGDQEQSKKRAQYILLLQRPDDAETLARLEQFAK